ncbi:hypothetical protein BDZ89DRAFT_1051508 [Hymenopellis radicata]|nr:hypothetical protein BDZ89DRAFT_1051508 [Hymenopellis radicata]
MSITRVCPNRNLGLYHHYQGIAPSLCNDDDDVWTACDYRGSCGGVPAHWNSVAVINTICTFRIELTCELGFLYPSWRRAQDVGMHVMREPRAMECSAFVWAVLWCSGTLLSLLGIFTTAPNARPVRIWRYSFSYFSLKVVLLKNLRFLGAALYYDAYGYSRKCYSTFIVPARCAFYVGVTSETRLKSNKRPSAKALSGTDATTPKFPRRMPASFTADTNSEHTRADLNTLA